MSRIVTEADTNLKRIIHMSTRTVGMAIIIVILGNPGWVRAQATEINRVAPTLAKAIAASGAKTVAVADFTDLQGRVTELGRHLAEELSVALVNTEMGLRVVDRGHIRALLDEHKLAAQGIIDPSTAAELGRIAGVEILLTGSISEVG
ncbi:MAG: CsgG/HfaB family protein, partial [Gemmatimonadota bacterium]